MDSLQALTEFVAACRGLNDSVNVATIQFTGMPILTLTVGDLRGLLLMLQAKSGKGNDYGQLFVSLADSRK